MMPRVGQVLAVLGGEGWGFTLRTPDPMPPVFCPITLESGLGAGSPAERGWKPKAARWAGP